LQYRFYNCVSVTVSMSICTAPYRRTFYNALGALVPCEQKCL